MKIFLLLLGQIVANMHTEIYQFVDRAFIFTTSVQLNGALAGAANV